MDLTAINDALVSFTGVIDDFMYTYILVILLVIVGIWFTVRTKFVQIRYIKDMFTSLTASSDRIQAEEAADELESELDEECDVMTAECGVRQRPMRARRSASPPSRRSWYPRHPGWVRAISWVSPRLSPWVALGRSSGCGSWPS